MKNIYLAGVAVALALSAQALGPSVRIQPSSASQPLGTPQRFDIPARQSGMGGPVMRLGENSPLKPPFTETFDNLRLGMEHDDFSRYFQVIDANQDGREWGLYNYADFKPYGRCAYMLFPMEDVRSADDWLVTRAIQLEAGKYYAITLDAALYRDATPEFAQRFEVKIGSYNDPDGLKTTVIEPTDIYSTTFSHHRGWFSPRVSGKYYVGVHGISPMYKNYYNYLFVDNIGVDAPKNGTEPNEVTDVEFVNDPTGSTRLDITFKAPAVNVANRPLSGKISAITVKRDGSVIKTFTDVEPGAALSLSDTPSSEGEYGYEFQVDNAGESGVPVFIRHYAGVGAPMAPASIAILENSDHSVEITWEEPTADVNGTPINPEALVYNIYQVVDGKAELIGSTDAVNVFDYEPEIAEGNQVLLSVAVTATLREKESDPVVSSEIPLGTPYGLPHHNSFNNEDYYRYIMTMERDDEDVTWRMLDNMSQPDAQDGDNGYVCMIGILPGQEAELRSGKIALDCQHPYISFYTYVYPEDENTITVTITDPDSRITEDVVKFKLSDYADRTDWVRMRADLSKYTGKTVIVGLRGEIVSHGYIPVDNLTIDDTPAVDLEIGGITHPSGAKAGEEFKVGATVKNYGVSASGTVRATLVCGDLELATTTLPSLAREESAPIELTHKFSAVSPQMGTFTIEVEAEGEGVPENNVSEPFQIALLAPSLPVPASLRVSEPEDGQDMLVIWEAPDLEKAAPAEETEDFEECIPFGENIDGSEWTTYDADGGYVGGFSQIDMPLANTQQGFFVMENEAPYDFLDPMSGTKMAVQMYGFGKDTHTYTVDCDDWLISPVLYGGPQTAGFWASSISNDNGLEIFEVYYSTKDSGHNNFIKLMDATEAPVAWTQFYVSLPDGARRFAIRCITVDGYMMFVDDITYTPAGKPLPLQLMGYNLYVDGNLKTPTPVQATEFPLPQLQKGSRIAVTAVYDKGESIPATVEYGASGVSMIEEEGETCDAEYYTIEGIKVAPGNLRPGVYIRRQGNSVMKIRI